MARYVVLLDWTDQGAQCREGDGTAGWPRPHCLGPPGCADRDHLLDAGDTTWLPSSTLPMTRPSRQRAAGGERQATSAPRRCGPSTKPRCRRSSAKLGNLYAALMSRLRGMTLIEIGRASSAVADKGHYLLIDISLK